MINGALVAFRLEIFSAGIVTEAFEPIFADRLSAPLRPSEISTFSSVRAKFEPASASLIARGLDPSFVAELGTVDLITCKSLLAILGSSWPSNRSDAAIMAGLLGTLLTVKVAVLDKIPTELESA